MGALAGAFLVPFPYGLYRRKATKLSSWASFIAGSGIMIIDMICPAILPQIVQHPVNCGAIIMLLGLINVTVVTWITSKMNKNDVEEMLSCCKNRLSFHQSHPRVINKHKKSLFYQEQGFFISIKSYLSHG